MGLVYLLVSGFCEVVMVFCLKKSEGFTRKMWSLGMIVFAGVSLVLLSFAMKTTEAGIAYSIWVAIGSIGSLAMGALLFGDQLNRQQLFFIGLIIVSVIGLKI